MKSQKSNFLQNSIALFIFIGVVFSSLFYFENKRLEVKKQTLVELSVQGTQLTEHLYIIAQIQGHLELAVENMIIQTSKFKAQAIGQSDFFADFDSNYQIVLKNLTMSLNEYNKMKQYLTNKNSDYLLRFLSIELYLNEVNYLSKTIEKAVGSIKSERLDPVVLSQTLDDLTKASESIAKVNSTYKSEIRMISSNIQNLATEGYNDIYSSNLVMSILSGTVIFSFILYTLFVMIIPLHRIADHTDSLLTNPHFIEDAWSYPSELQDIIKSMENFSSKVLSKENELKQERAQFRDYTSQKKELYGQIDKELSLPMEVLNRTLHRVHNDNLTKENLKLVELAESEYLHLKDLINNASLVASNDISTKFENNYSSTDVTEYLSGCVNSIIRELGTIKKIYTQVSPGIPTHLYLDQNRVRDIIRYAIESLSVYKNDGNFAVTATETKLHEEQYLLIDIYFEKQSQFRDKIGYNYLSLYTEHRANSTSFKTYQSIANFLGGTLDFKIKGEELLEFRLMLPLVGVDELNEELVG